MLTKTRNRKTERLARLPLFATCSQGELRKVAEVADEVEVAAGTTLAVAGHPVREVLIVSGGRASALTDDDAVETLTFGAQIGDTELITGAPGTRTVLAATPVSVVVIEARRFNALIERIPSVARQLLKTHALASRHANDRTHGRVVAMPSMRPLTA